MPTIRIVLDRASFDRLAELAVEARRPLPWHDEVLLLQALGRWPNPEAPKPAGAMDAPAVARD